ncbi:hypothetical protein B9Z19DRAFT_1064378 [Tuber borchii]|uniref:Uncharacterized protein n=1 Tax=Tuber borchii TaxID=42251 RepID=A0A2T6ZUU0_TUBBO|nr:hypothetical protein B9Z19DRAFT_1064378 [Tuber borchii]
MRIAQFLDWVAYLGPWIVYLPEVPKVYWKKWVSESWVSVWAHFLISHVGRKRHEGTKGDDKEDFEATTYNPEPAMAAPIRPIANSSIHCTGSTLTDYVNPYSSSPPSLDLLLPESYPLPTAIVPDTSTTQQLYDEDPFKTPMPPRAGDPGFLDAYPSPEGGSKWQRGKKSLAEKEMGAWKFARKIESKAPEVSVKEFKPSPGSEPGFLDAYPCPQPVPTKWLEDVVEGNVKQDGNGGSDNSKEENSITTHLVEDTIEYGSLITPVQDPTTPTNQSRPTPTGRAPWKAMQTRTRMGGAQTPPAAARRTVRKLLSSARTIEPPKRQKEQFPIPVQSPISG